MGAQPGTFCVIDPQPDPRREPEPGHPQATDLKPDLRQAIDRELETLATDQVIDRELETLAIDRALETLAIDQVIDRELETLVTDRALETLVTGQAIDRELAIQAIGQVLEIPTTGLPVPDLLAFGLQDSVHPVAGHRPTDHQATVRPDTDLQAVAHLATDHRDIDLPDQDICLTMGTVIGDVTRIVGVGMPTTTGGHLRRPAP